MSSITSWNRIETETHDPETRRYTPMLMRFDPFREFDRLTQQAFGPGARTVPAMPMDAYRHGDYFVIHFDVPGG